MFQVLMTPLIMKKIEPNDWTEWWNIWDRYAGVLEKAHKNHNNADGVWKGLDLYTKVDLKMIYSAPHAPQSSVIDDLISQIEEQIPINLMKVRVIENNQHVPFHSDHSYETHELRCFLWNTYEEPVWSFDYQGTVKKLELPDDTNTWYYKDYPMKHSSIYDKNRSKGVMAIYGVPKINFKDFISDSAEHYKNFSWII